MLILIWGLVAFLVVVVWWWISTFNQFVRLDKIIAESWSNVDIALKRRSDVIPNLVETAKGYAAHEKELLERISMARERTLTADSTADRSKSETELTQCTLALFARAEAYPELKADEHFRELQVQIADTEDRIAAARRLYNGNVRSLNVLRESFPSSIVANSKGVQEAELFELDDPSVRNSIKVSF